MASYLPPVVATAGAPPTEDAEISAFEERTRVIVTEWEQRLEVPAALGLIRDFDAEPFAAGRDAARSPAFAERLSEGLDEDFLLAAVFVRNPKIQSAALMLRSRLEQYAQVTYLDAILSQYASFQRSSRTRVGMPLREDRIDQHFPFPGSLELKAAIVRHSIEEAHALYRAVVRDLVVSARTTFARYAFNGRAESISEATIAYLSQLEEAARAKLSAGTGSKGAVIQVQVELSNLRNELVTLRQQRTVLQAALATLLDVRETTAIGTPKPSSLPRQPPAPDVLEVLADEQSPDIAGVRARLARMQTMIELAEQTAYPAFSAGLSNMEGPSHATGGSDKEREPFSTRPKIKPDPWFGSKEAYLRESRERVRAAEARLRATRNDTAFAVKRATVDLETARRLQELYVQVQLAQAEQAYRDASAGYAADRVEFLNVVDTLRRWLQFQLAADKATRDIQTSHARLEGAVGAPLGE